MRRSAALVLSLALGLTTAVLTPTQASAETADLVVTKSASTSDVSPGEWVGYTITVTNTTPDPITVDTVTDVLPAGFEYNPGNTWGMTADDPTTSGNTLTWTVDTEVVGGAAETLSFYATVPQSYGTFYNSATATAAGATVQGSGDTAPVDVAPNPMSFYAYPDDGSVGLSWYSDAVGVSDARLFYQEGDTAPGYEEGTEVDVVADDWWADVTGLTNGTEYSFSLFLLDSNGEIVDQASLSATPQRAPMQLYAFAGNRSAELWWESTDPAVTEYELYYKADEAPMAPGDGTQVPLDTPKTNEAVVTGLVNGTMYGFTVFALDADGNIVEESSAYAMPELVPMSLDAYPGDREVDLYWELNDPAVDRYQVYYRPGDVPPTPEDGTPVPLNDPLSESVLVEGLTNDTLYSFLVVALDADGNVIDQATTSATPYGIPMELYAYSGDREVDLYWESSEPAVTHYQVRYQSGGTAPGLDEGTEWPLDDPLADYTTVEGLTNGTPYSFAVFALDADGNVIEDASATATPQRIPMELEAYAGDREVELYWSSNDPDIARYELRYLEGDTGPGLDEGTEVPLDDPRAEWAMAEGLTNGTQYTFTVFALDSAGGIIEQDSASATPQRIPMTVDAYAGDREVELYWESNDPAVTQYQVFYQDGPTPPARGEGIAVPLDHPLSTDALVTGLMNDVTYSFAVYALDSYGDVVEQAFTSATPERIPMWADAYGGDREVDLEWRSYDPAVTSYQVWYQTGTTPPGLGEGTQATLDDPLDRYTTVEGLTNGTTYAFSVFALDADGAIVEQAYATAQPERIPLRLYAWEDDGAVDLEWYSADPAIAEYRLYYKEGTTAPTMDNGTEVPLNDPLATWAYVDGLTNGTTYSFTVFSLDADGNVIEQDSDQATPQRVPLWLYAEAGDREVELYWESNEPSVTEYQLYYAPGTTAPGTDGTQVPLDDPLDTYAIVDRLENGTTYGFTVLALDADGNVVEEDSAFATPQRIPMTLYSYSGDREVELDWHSGDPALAEYRLFYAEGTSTPTMETGTEVTLDGPLAEYAVVDGLTNDTTYSFTVYALDADGNVLEQDSVYGTPKRIPMELWAWGDDQAVELEWGSNDPTVTEYQLFYAVGDTAPGMDDGTAVPLADPLSEYATVDGLTNGTTYSFTVFALDETGAVVEQDSAVAVPRLGPPRHLEASDGGPNTVRLSWDNSPSADGVIIRYSSQDWPESPTEGTGVEVPAGAESVDISGLTENTEYYFTAWSVQGEQRSAYASYTDFFVEPPPPNAAPVAGDDSATTKSKTPVDISVLDNDDDADGDALHVSDKTNGTHGTVTCTSTVCTYTPTGTFRGEDTFTYTVSDGNGGTDTATVTVTVTNQGPDAVNDSTSTPSKTAVEVDVLDNDTDPENDTLTVTGKTNGTNGTVSCTGTTCTYTPTGNFRGADTFTYTISDGKGGSDTATVAVTVANQDPNAVDDAASTPSKTAKQINVLANDTDPENDTLSITGHTDGTNGTVECTGTTCTYTPTGTFRGQDTFTYTVGDGNGGSDTATVTMTVTNQGPDAVNDNGGSVVAGGDKAIDVLANDTDPENDTLSITGHTNGSKGTVECTGTTCTYSADAGATGNDSFTYTVSDGNGGTDTATVSVTVSPAEPGSVSIDVADPAVDWPEMATVTGVLETATGAPLPDRSVELWTKPAGGDWKKVGADTSDDDGVVSMEDQPLKKASYQWRVVGTTIKSDAFTVTVAPSVTTDSTVDTMPVNGKLVVKGAATPVKAGQKVVLEIQKGTRWETVASTELAKGSTALSGGSPYSLKAKQTRPGTFTFRVTVSAGGGRVAASGEPFTVSVYKAKVASFSKKGTEVMVIENVGSVPFDTDGWVLKSKTGKGTLPAVTVEPGGKLSIFTGAGTNTSTEVYLGVGDMFGNKGDTITLKDGKFLVVKHTY